MNAPIRSGNQFAGLNSLPRAIVVYFPEAGWTRIQTHSQIDAQNVREVTKIVIRPNKINKDILSQMTILTFELVRSQTRSIFIFRLCKSYCILVTCISTVALLLIVLTYWTNLLHLISTNIYIHLSFRIYKILWSILIHFPANIHLLQPVEQFFSIPFQTFEKKSCM